MKIDFCISNTYYIYIIMLLLWMLYYLVHLYSLHKFAFTHSFLHTCSQARLDGIEDVLSRQQKALTALEHRTHALWRSSNGMSVYED